MINKGLVEGVNLEPGSEATVCESCQWAKGTRDCHRFTNPCGSQVWVGKGVGTGWPFTPLEKPKAMAWVSQRFTGS